MPLCGFHLNLFPVLHFTIFYVTNWPESHVNLRHYGVQTHNSWISRSLLLFCHVSSIPEGLGLRHPRCRTRTQHIEEFPYRCRRLRSPLLESCEFMILDTELLRGSQTVCAVLIHCQSQGLEPRVGFRSSMRYHVLICVQSQPLQRLSKDIGWSRIRPWCWQIRPRWLLWPSPNQNHWRL